MKSRIVFIWKHLAVAILGALGFSSCGEGVLDPDKGQEILAMYGSPYADFKLLGTVKDEAGEPIEGIRVAVRREWSRAGNPIIGYEADTIFTDSKGGYLLEKRIWPTVPDLTVVFEDIDGVEHGGEFKPAELKPDVKYAEESTGPWNRGRMEAHADVVLNKK